MLSKTVSAHSMDIHTTKALVSLEFVLSTSNLHLHLYIDLRGTQPDNISDLSPVNYTKELLCTGRVELHAHLCTFVYPVRLQVSWPYFSL